MKNLLQLFLGLFLFASPAHIEAGSREQEMVDAIQKNYEAVDSFKALFVQKAFVKMINQVQETRGEVQIKKPGKMKWVYNSPDPQILVSNEKTLWLYVPEDEQVIKMPMDNIYTSNTPALFLAGRGRLTQSFEVAQVTEDENQITLIQKPRDEEHSLQKLVLFADNKNYQITGSSVYDKLGNKTEIWFSDIRINEEISEETFHFEIPPGIELLDYTPNLQNQ